MTQAGAAAAFPIALVEIMISLMKMELIIHAAFFVLQAM
jgi:hypothetical protein